MKTRIAINGFGRIGRNFLRTIMSDPQALEKLEIVAINIGPSRADYSAHMFKYDTLMGTYPGQVTMSDSELIVDGHKIAIITESDPSNAPWQSLKIDWVVESSGYFTHREGAQKHIIAGARSVLITAPAHDEDVAVVPGVNDDFYNPAKHTIVSLGSCTTNAMVPTLKVLHDAFVIEQAMMTTVHAYTNTQVLLDVECDDLRRARAAALNIVPASTGASKMLAKVLPDLADKVVGMSLRVPVAKVSIVDISFTCQKDISPEIINKVFAAAAASGPLVGKLALSYDPLVSSDYSGSPYSVVIDAQMTQVVKGMGKVFGWYDNEWGYSMRLKDFLSKNS